MRITFWGVRGSFPQPLSAEELLQRQKDLLREIRLCGLPSEEDEDRFLKGLPTALRSTVGGNTPCVELATGGQVLIFDAGSGLCNLGRQLMQGPCGRGKGHLKLFISHTHWDHIQGLPYFAPMHVEGNRIAIFSGFDDMERRLECQQNPEFFPVPLSAVNADISFHQLTADVPVELTSPGDHGSQVNVIAHELPHPGGAYGFRVENGAGIFVYASDSDFTSIEEDETRGHLEFFRNADVLVFDAHFSFRESIHLCGWGHASAVLGAKLASLAEVKELILFHHSPEYSDEMLDDLLARARIHSGEKFPEKIYLAREGVVVEPPCSGESYPK
jgi:phosphoribosyl 1,2-cyclic phosphodiesterase